MFWVVGACAADGGGTSDPQRRASDGSLTPKAGNSSAPGGAAAPHAASGGNLQQAGTGAAGVAGAKAKDAAMPPASDGAVPKVDGGLPQSGASAPNSDAGPATEIKAGNPDGKCSETLPAQAKLADTSKPTSVVGTGSAASCTFDKLSAAIAQGGVITFDCGAAPVTIMVSSTLELRTDRDTVIDGANKITLDGGNNVRVLHWNGTDWQKNTHTLTLQHLTLAHGKAVPTEMIPMRPAPCSQGYNDGEGGALLMRDGSLRAIDVVFLDNQAAELGPDTGGGALYLLGCQPAYIVSCTFRGNKASNAGAMGSLFTTDFIYDSLFDNNAAVGHGANNNDASMCMYMNNGQNEVGSGGNGGAIYSDGVAMDVTICGTQLRNNTAGAFGAAVFFTSNDQSKKGTLKVKDSLMFNNKPADSGWEWKPGISTNGNTPEPIASDIRR